jgi:PAS domain S-box-containing protein
MAVMRDITERKLSEATLLESEARFRTAISEAPVPIMIHREDGKVLQISKGWTKYSGYDLEDIPTIRDWTDRAYGQASSEIYEYIKTLYSIEETRSGGERTVIAKNGHKRIWQFTATPLGAFGDDQRVIINTAFDVTESQQAEAEREAISREIVATWESMTDAFYSLDTQWNITRINSQAAQLIRCSVEELIGKSLWEQYPAALGLSFYTEFHRAVEEQVPVSFEEFFPPHNAWYEVHAYPSPNGLSVYFRDITERKQADAALRESEKRFKDIVANVPGMVYQFGRHVDGTISWPFVSNGCREMFEVEAESIKQNPSLPLDMIHPEDRDEFDRSMMAAKEALEPWSWQGRFRMPSGEIKWIEGAAHPQRLSDGGTLYTGLLMDFTARKQAETERDRFFTLSLDMLAITGSDGYFKRLNPAWEAILGFSNAELMAVPFLEFVHPDDIADTLAEMAKLSSGVRVMQFENRFRCHNGSYKWLRWMSAPFEESWYCVAHDITGVKETETALQQVNDDLEMRVKERTAELGAANESLRVENIEHQMTMATLREVAQALQKAKEEADIANAAKSEFLSRMSHELRTPLNAILGFGQILETQDLDPLANESIGFILSGGRHLLGLINEVLDIARVESGHIELSLEPIALNDIVPEACSLMRHLATDRHIGLGENTSKLGHVYVRADRQRLKQVLINLLANAIKYNRESGQVEVICQHRPDGWIDIAVRDTGPGIPPQDLSKLFTPFERLGAANSEIEGTGLGLVLSQRLVAVMGGTLKVESTLGLGTTFTVSLPQAIAPEKQLTNLREGNELKDGYSFDVEQPDQNTYTVLCIEDNPSNLRLMEAIFENRPEITLLTAIQGSIGLDLARQHEPDLILLDLNLPDIHGSEVLTRLRQSALTIDIPVVVISADATQNQIERLLTAGAMAYLTKPLDLSQFLRTLDEFLPRNLTVDPQPDMDEESTN